MRRISKIGSITLDYPLFIKEEFDSKNVKGVAYSTLSGGKIIYETVKRNNANYITLISKDSGWQKEQTIDNILILLDDIDVSTTITDKNDIITNVRPAVENGNIVTTTDAINEAGSWVKVTINLCEV